MAQLHIGLDLGGDTLKIAFAYEDRGFIRYGKFSNKSRLTQIAFPALAYYDQANAKWFFGDQIGKQSESFITIVKIKNLISLLSINSDRNVWERNKAYYYNGDQFPKFNFPARRKIFDNYQEMIESGRTFAVEGCTPQSVCEDFFDYAKSLVEERKKELESYTNLTFNEIKVAVVHPSSVGDEYVHELSMLIEKSFGSMPTKILSTNKALAMNAIHRNMVAPNEDFLVFDMGEEDIAVVRAGILKGNVIIDGVEGHSDPLPIGGIDVDEAIITYLEKSISERETLGSPSCGQEGHICESGVYGKQYLLMKDIKKAKVIFSKNVDGEYFPNGVPVTFCWDLCIQRRITKEDLRKSIGVTDKTGVAQQIVDYIIGELKLPINHDIRKIFISGGLTETYSLLEYIKQELSALPNHVEVCTFDDNRNIGNDFTILSYEDSVFAPSVGGAIVSLKNIDIKTVTSLSYATWVYDSNVKVLDIFVDRGTPIEAGDVFTTTINLRGWGVPSDEEMYSTYVTREKIKQNRYNGKWSFSQGGQVIIGEPGSASRMKACSDIGLHVVTGGKRGQIYFKYRGRRVYVSRDYKIVAEEGIRVDKNGRATPIIRNVSPDSYVMIASSATSTNYERVRASMLEICTEGLNVIDITNE